MRSLIVGINGPNNSAFLAVNYKETCREQIVSFYPYISDILVMYVNLPADVKSEIICMSSKKALIDIFII